MKNKYDMEYYHCGHCNKYVSPDEGYYGDADRADGGYQCIYCDEACCTKEEGMEAKNES